MPVKASRSSIINRSPMVYNMYGTEDTSHSHSRSRKDMKDTSFKHIRNNYSEHLLSHSKLVEQKEQLVQEALPMRHEIPVR